MARSNSQLFSVLLLLLTVVGGMAFVWPLRGTVADLRVQADARAVELEQAQADLDSLNELAEQVGGSDSAKEALLDSVPVGPDQDELILELSELASKSGFDLNAMNFSLSSDAELGSSLNVAANFSGDYDKLVNFLQRIESADRLMRVSNLTIQLTSTESVVFNVNIEAFYQ